MPLGLTYLDDFKLKHPNGPISGFGVPYGLCRYVMYNGYAFNPCGRSSRNNPRCARCWKSRMGTESAVYNKKFKPEADNERENAD